MLIAFPLLQSHCYRSFQPYMDKAMVTAILSPLLVWKSIPSPIAPQTNLPSPTSYRIAMAVASPSEQVSRVLILKRGCSLMWTALSIATQVARMWFLELNMSRTHVWLWPPVTRQILWGKYLMAYRTLRWSGTVIELTLLGVILHAKRHIELQHQMD